MNKSVLVAGAGPAGLALALQAHDHGAVVRVVDRRPEVVRPSRALILHARTLEVLRPLGVTPTLLTRADIAPAADLRLGASVIRVSFGDLALPDTAFPHLTLVRQMDVERVLADALAGDAAHAYSPATGQGMNAAIQDAANLGWKLAFAAARPGDGPLLDSYDREPRPMACELAVRVAPVRGRSSTSRCTRPGRGGSAQTASTTTASAAPVQASISRVGSPSVSTSSTPGGTRSRRLVTTASPAPSSRRNSLPTPITTTTRTTLRMAGGRDLWH